MKLLLVNTNRYRTPPVPPIALEYLTQAARIAGHECRILDLCFSEKPLEDIDRAVNEFRPALAGVTVRNIDTVLFDNNVFFLDGIREMVARLHHNGVPVVAGGVGFSFQPKEILGYIGADWGVCGPGERALTTLLDSFDNPPQRGALLDGRKFGFDPDMPVVRGEDIDYPTYIAEGGIAGFQTQKGCRERCFYCGEGNGEVWFRNPKSIVGELRSLTDKGITDFHLCDTEFNQDIDFCKAFLEELVASGPKVTWALYMKERPYDIDLFRLVKKSGANLVTVSVPTGGGLPGDLPALIAYAKDAGLRVAIDLLVGFPGDTFETISQQFDKIRTMNPRPDTVGVNATLRLYSNCPVTAAAFAADANREFITGDIDDNPGFIRPVFYRRFTPETLREIIGDDPLFTIEGFERTSNYQRLKKTE